MEDNKHPARSKTIWFNVIMLILGSLAAAGYVDVQAGDADALAGFIVDAIAVVNIVLRMVTKKPLSTGG